MTATDERAALCRAIIDAPKDDAPRLVYADWLEEYGDEDDRLRAEFIRLQVKLDRAVGIEAVTGRIVPWREMAFGARDDLRRERALLNLPLDPQSAAFAWSQPIHRLGIALGRPWPDVFVFRRGFVAEVRAPLDVLLDHGPEIVKAHPVEKMVASDKTPWEGRRSLEEPVEWFGWWNVRPGTHEAAMSWSLPMGLLGRMEADPRRVAYEPNFYVIEGSAWVMFRSPDDALAALRDALLTHCQEEAARAEAEKPAAV